jgi:hypothetical protein
MDTIILIEIGLQRYTFEEKWHIDEIILFSKTGKYCFVFFTVFTSEIEWSSHPSKEYGNIFGLEFFYDGTDIFLDLGWVFSLEGIIATDTENRECGSVSLEEPVHP